MNKYSDFLIRKMTMSKAEAGEKISEVSVRAACTLLKNRQDIERIRMLILVTQEADFLFPSTAFVVHKELGLSQYCMVYDINLGTDGFLSALEQAAGLLIPYKDEEALVVAADSLEAVAAVVGHEEGIEAEFYHYTDPGSWHMIWGSRWDKDYRIDLELFRQRVEMSEKQFMKHRDGHKNDCVVAPQCGMYEEIKDSPTMIPAEIVQKSKEIDKDVIYCSCMGCGAGISVA